MAADYGKLAENLRHFYDFADKTVLYVGAGGRQLLNRSIEMKKLIAIDQDLASLSSLQAQVAATATARSTDIIVSKFADVQLAGDVVYFEFCLHEMPDPAQALAHAKALARDIVVFDHSPESDWSFYAAEEDKVRRAAEAMERFGIRRRESFCSEQRFRYYAELLAKVTSQGRLATQRARRFVGATDIVIPMNYQLALL
jgi:hypothetical protein